MSEYLFEGATPNRYLWVDASAPSGGTGAEDSPLNNIQTALAKAKPGTAIMVKAGEYHTNISIPRTADGTAEAPIWLVSADGPQKAHIIATDSGRAAIGGGGVQNFIVDGFWVTGGKNGIQFSQNGYDYTDTIANIVVRNNLIESPVEDGIKANGGENVYVHDNIIRGGRDEGIDYVSIVNGVIANNEVSGNTGTSAAIFAKFGSENIVIRDNYVHDNAAIGISVGGYVNAEASMRDGCGDYQAKNVLVEGNVVTGNGRVAMAVFGSQDTVITGNYIEGNSSYFAALYVGHSNETKYGTFTSHNTQITGNYLAGHRKPVYLAPGSDGLIFEDNAAAVDTHEAGANIGGLEFYTPPAPEPETPPEDSGPTKEDLEAFRLLTLNELFKKEWLESAPSNHVFSKGGTGTDDADLLKGNATFYAGGAGDDVYELGQGSVGRVLEEANGGIDTLRANGQYVRLANNVENLLLTSSRGALLVGNEGDNHISGNVGEDYIVGGGGKNLLSGNGGADHFVIALDDALTRITDFTADDQIHIVGENYSSFDDLKAAMTELNGSTVLSLEDGRHIIFDNSSIADFAAAQFGFAEAAPAMAMARMAFASPAVEIVGKVLSAAKANNIAKGTDGNDTITGNGSAMLVGGAGNDAYILKAAGDHIIEEGNGGIDTVLLHIGEYTLASGVENARVRIDTGVQVTGNGLDNMIIGANGADRITGGEGADTLTGRGGADVFAYGSLRHGGDIITDFQVGLDHLDARELFASSKNASLRAEASADGLHVYAEVAGHETLLVTLSGVAGEVALHDLLI